MDKGYIDYHISTVLKAFIDFDLGSKDEPIDSTDTIGTRINMKLDEYQLFNEALLDHDIEETLNKYEIFMSLSGALYHGDYFVDYRIKKQDLKLLQTGYKFAKGEILHVERNGI